MFTDEMEQLVRDGRIIKVLEPSSDGYPGRTLCMIKRDWYIPTTSYFGSLWYNDHSRIVRYGMNDPLLLFRYLDEMVGRNNYPPDEKFKDGFDELWREGYSRFISVPYTHIVNISPSENVFCWNGSLFEIGVTKNYESGAGVFEAQE